MPGVHDYAGSKIGTLDVGQMIRRNPEPVVHKRVSPVRSAGAKSHPTSATGWLGTMPGGQLRKDREAHES